MTDLTYYQARDKYINLSEEEKKLKKENIEKTDIMACLKKRNKRWKNIKKITMRLNSLYLTINKTVF